VKYVEEFRRGGAARRLSNDIAGIAGEETISLMEVCGTHTMAIARYGIRSLLPGSIHLISGPGCPVCVTPNRIVDHAIALSREPGVVVTTFGDMMKVPGSSSSLDREHARGCDIRVVASTLEALAIAEHAPEKQVVFLGVGFETTVPTIAVSILEAEKRELTNYSVLSAHKTMPQAMAALSAVEVAIDGYLCPGHVSTIIGSEPYGFIVRDHGIGCVIAGFEPLDILQSILLLVRQVREGAPRVEIQYTRAVRPGGNPAAREVVDRVFEPCDSEWRGIGMIPGSGLRLRDAYAGWDSGVRFSVDVEPTHEAEGCLCGLVLQGRARPTACRHFGTTCTPVNPVGPCMVSTEGTCAAYFKYQIQR